MERIGAGRTAEVYLDAEGRAVKLFRLGFERAMPVEYEVSQRIARMDISAPAVYGTVTVEGRPGIVYERLTGPSMLHRLMADPQRLPQEAELLARISLQIHGCTADAAFPDAKAWLASRIRQAPQPTPPERQAVLAYLAALPDGDRLLHLDLHPDNIMGSAAHPRVIDWNNACRGMPVADVCRTQLMLAAGSTPDMWQGEGAQLAAFRQALRQAYVQAYCALSGQTEAEIARWMLPVAAARLADGIEEEAEYLLAVVRGALQA